MLDFLRWNFKYLYKFKKYIIGANASGKYVVGRANGQSWTTLQLQRA